MLNILFGFDKRNTIMNRFTCWIRYRIVWLCSFIIGNIWLQALLLRIFFSLFLFVIRVIGWLWGMEIGGAELILLDMTYGGNVISWFRKPPHEVALIDPNESFRRDPMAPSEKDLEAEFGDVGFNVDVKKKPKNPDNSPGFLSRMWNGLYNWFFPAPVVENSSESKAEIGAAVFKSNTNNSVSWWQRFVNFITAPFISPSNPVEVSFTQVWMGAKDVEVSSQRSASIILRDLEELHLKVRHNRDLLTRYNSVLFELRKRVNDFICHREFKLSSTKSYRNFSALTAINKLVCYLEIQINDELEKNNSNQNVSSANSSLPSQVLNSNKAVASVVNTSSENVSLNSDEAVTELELPNPNEVESSSGEVRIVAEVNSVVKNTSVSEPVVNNNIDESAEEMGVVLLNSLVNAEVISNRLATYLIHFTEEDYRVGLTRPEVIQDISVLPPLDARVNNVRFLDSLINVIKFYQDSKVSLTSERVFLGELGKLISKANTTTESEKTVWLSYEFDEFRKYSMIKSKFDILNFWKSAANSDCTDNVDLSNKIKFGLERFKAQSHGLQRFLFDYLEDQYNQLLNAKAHGFVSVKEFNKYTAFIYDILHRVIRWEKPSRGSGF